MIYGPDPKWGGYSISSRRVWLPGVYEDERTARYAFRFCGCQLQALQDAANARESDYTKRVIRYEDLRPMAQALRKVCGPSMKPLQYDHGERCILVPSGAPWLTIGGDPRVERVIDGHGKEEARLVIPLSNVLAKLISRDLGLAIVDVPGDPYAERMDAIAAKLEALQTAPKAEPQLCYACGKRP